MTDPASRLEDEQPITHHYILVLVVEVLTLTALWWFSRMFR